MQFFHLHITKAIAAIFCVLFISSAIQAQADAKKVIEKYLTKESSREDASEYEGAREIRRGDLNGDGKPDIAVLYTLEYAETNSYRQFMAIFINRGNRYDYAAKTIVGGKDYRSMRMKSITHGQINFASEEYLENDPSCCPSKKVNVSFIFNQGVVKEINSKRSAK